MSRVPKAIREATKDLDTGQFRLGHTTKHYAIVRKDTGQVIYTLHSNTANRSDRNMRAEMKRMGLLKVSK
jgi:Tfp pilus assembly ATPase PilU